MIRKQKDEVQWLEFELLQGIQGLVHGVFLRHGGISAKPFDSLNAGGGTGDEPEDIRENRRRMLSALDLKESLSANQVHGSHVDLEDGLLLEEGCDGILTQEQGLGLMIKHADCQAALFYDPVHRAIGNVHAGWRGSVQNIYAKAIDKMRTAFNSRPEDLLVCISPSLGPDASQFIHYKTELPESFLPYQFKPLYFDFWAISRDQLQACGILPHHIEIASICTFGNPQDFFSYRRDKPATGRHATLIALN
jgi:polyphenol oxidase